MRHTEKLKQIVSNAYALWLNEISIFWVIQMYFSLYQVSLLEKLFLHFITSRRNSTLTISMSGTVEIFSNE